MKAVASVFRSEKRFRAAQRLGRMAERPLVHNEPKQDGLVQLKGETATPGWIGWLPGLMGGWTQVRDLQAMPEETFREWWEKRGAQ
jgi:L-lactate dehydrogenase complex protein LldF